MVPPNPIAATMDLPAGAGKDFSGFDTGLHWRQWEFMKGVSRGWFGADSSAASCSVQGQSAAERPSGRMLLTATPGKRRTRTR